MPNQKYRPSHCGYCKRGLTASHIQRDTSYTDDHIILKSKNGPRAEWNLIPSCFRCNNLRGNLNQEIFSMFARDVICQYPDAPAHVLRQSLMQFVTSLAEIAIRNKKESRQAVSLALLSVAEKLRAL